jgi:hypothetical protein
LKKDFVECPGCNGLVSKRALEIMDLEAFKDFIMFPLTVNDASYFALYSTKNVDSLDAKNSVYEDRNYQNGGFWEMEKYAFHLDKIKENTVFSVPQTNHFLYCTQEIGRRILENELNIIALPLLAVEEDLRPNRVIYDNPAWGIHLEEPKNWVMDFLQLNTLKAGKKIGKTAWKTDIPSNKGYLSLFEMRRFELLKSNNWRQKAEIFVSLVHDTPEEVFKGRLCVAPIEFEHPNLHFEAQINEYQWERTLVAPFKNGLNLVVVVVNRDEDKKFVDEALEVVRNMRFS